MPRLRGVFDVVAAIATVAAVMMLVRPGSRGPQLVAGLGAAFQAATVGTVGSTIVPDQRTSSTTPTSSSSSTSSTSSTGPGAPYDPSNYQTASGAHLGGGSSW